MLLFPISKTRRSYEARIFLHVVPNGPEESGGGGGGVDLPPTGAAKQVATPTALAHTNRSWLWVPFWG